MTDSNQVAGLAAWRDVRTKLDKSPWPGPRPLRKNDKEVLVGRDEDKVRFRREVTAHRLVLLTGTTGVGKTSLIQAGLVPDLQASGYTVALCRDWSGSAVESDPVAFLAAKVRAQYADQVSFDLPPGAGLFWALNERLHEKCVVVLDQFEELIRDAPGLTDSLFTLLIELNRRTDLRVVVSFRSEFLHEMAPLEKNIRAYSLSHVALSPVAPEAAIDIVLAPDTNKRDNASRAITVEAADDVAQLWREAVEKSANAKEETRGGRLGLLHLQALLYVLASRCEGRTVERGDIKKLRLEYGSPVAVLHHGLSLAVQQKLNRCRQAASHPDVRLDRYLIDGTMQMVVECVPHLSSAGYKLVREIRDLTEATLGDRLESLRLGIMRDGAGAEDSDASERNEREAALLGALLGLVLPNRRHLNLDLLSVSRAEIATRADQALSAIDGRSDNGSSWAARLYDGRVGPEIDAADVTCGPMLGHAPAAVLIEELRRFMFALDWLRASDLIRITTPDSGGAMIALIHDGFGTALDEWAKVAGRGPSGELAALTAPRGGSFDWGATPERTGDTGSASRLLVNLRWRGAWVTAEFTDVVFVNCDFRGAGFSRCVFNGVAFVNCLLDGALFTDCVVTGEPPASERKWYPHAPRFRLPGTEALVADLEHYNESDAAATELLSQFPGLPAVPLIGEAEDALPLAERPAGLVVLGGRISTLMFRSCVIQVGSSVSFRHVAGSGLDVVEQPGGRFEVIGSALRHVAFSGVPSDADPAINKLATADLDVSLVTSSVVQLWISDDVSGNLLADDCMLLHAWNASANLSARAVNCSYSGLVGVAVDPDCTLLGPDRAASFVADIDVDKRVHTRVKRMDYRRDPHRGRLAPEEVAARLSAR